jgi:hypothetical protein
MKYYKTGILGVGIKGTAPVIVGGELRPGVVTEHGGMDPTLTLVHKLQQDAVSSVADPNLLYRFGYKYFLYYSIADTDPRSEIRCFLNPLYSENT